MSPEELMNSYRNPKKDGWISVKDQLPEIDQDCLVIQDPKLTATREPLFSTFEERHGEGKFRSYEKSGEFNHIGIGYWTDIIYWRPIPEPPK